MVDASITDNGIVITDDAGDTVEAVKGEEFIGLTVAAWGDRLTFWATTAEAKAYAEGILALVASMGAN